MNKYLSLIFLYNRASYKKLLLTAGLIPLSFLTIFLMKIGNPCEAGAQLLMERGFDGAAAVLVFTVLNLLALMAVATSLNGRKGSSAAFSTTGFTLRRLHISPIKAYLTVFVYYLAVILILWGVAVVSVYAIGKAGLTMAGASGIDVKLALGLLRTDIGHALLPIAHPVVMVFNIAVILTLAGECAKSCYLSWHNGTPSAGVLLIIIPAFLVWSNAFAETYMLMAAIILLLYAVFSFGDVIFREKRPKGDPFKANKYAGIMDMDSFEFDDSAYIAEINSPVEMYDPAELEKMLPQLYGGARAGGRRKGLKNLNPLRLRRRFLPIGINLERANTLLGGGIFIGIGEHLIFFFKYITRLNEIRGSMKGLSIADGVKMPYFWELQEHTCYGYIIAVLMVLFIQAYWNWQYYNKKTKSVYVMRRLPDRKEYRRTIWAAPVIQAVFIVVIMLAHIVIDLCIYVCATPEIALYADYLSPMLPF